MSATVETGWKKVCDSVEVPILTRCCLCFPLRKGLIGFAYLNLCITIVVTVFLSLYIASVNNLSESVEAPTGYIRLIADATAMVVELIMNVVFLVALHRKHVLLMKVYLYFNIVFSLFGFIYSVSFLSKETAGELFLMLLQLTLQIYLAILVWSSIVKMERDGAVKYTRERENV